MKSLPKQKAKQKRVRKCFAVDIGERLKIVRGKESRDNFASKIGVHPQSLYRYEQGGRSVDSTVISSVCEVYGVSTDWLIFGRGPMRRDDATDSPEGFVPAHECGNDADLIMIPRVSARLCAGTGSLETDDNVVGMYAFRAEWILKKGNTKRMVLMDVTGDSMAPDIKHGDIVLVDQSKTDIYGHGYYAVGVEDAIYIKEIMTSPGMLVLKSINPRYEDIKVSLGDDHASSVRIIGRVLWVGRELD